jgi:hypothetical protein
MRKRGPIPSGCGAAPGRWTAGNAGCQIDALTFDLVLEVR